MFLGDWHFAQCEVIVLILNKNLKSLELQDLFFLQQEGDRIGLIRKSNGHLHYYINGEDQGVASNETPPTIWGVVDLYGMAVKVSILDRNDPNYPNNISSPAQRARNIFRQYPDMYDEISYEGTYHLHKMFKTTALCSLSNYFVTICKRTLSACVDSDRSWASGEAAVSY